MAKYTIQTKLVPVNTVCALLGVSASTVRRLRNDENLPFYAFPGNQYVIILYDLEEVCTWAIDNKKPYNHGQAIFQHETKLEEWKSTLKG